MSTDISNGYDKRCLEVIWAVLGFATIGVLSTFSIVLTMVWEWLA
tara:strand:- start:20 stop:154 length:135 start_codon:yes stop_codon:yes gene_type:complete